MFDVFVMSLSIIEFGIGYKTGMAVSALRGFRLLRVANIVQSWQSLKMLIDSILHTIASIGNFTLLLALVIYVYALLGM